MMMIDKSDQLISIFKREIVREIDYKGNWTGDQVQKFNWKLGVLNIQFQNSTLLTTEKLGDASSSSPIAEDASL